ncbi:hypothetical protein Tco_1118651 [Tanacetum coccineum]
MNEIIPLGYIVIKNNKRACSSSPTGNSLNEARLTADVSDVEDSLVHDRFANVEGMHAVPPPMIGNYMPSGPDREVDDNMFTYVPKQSKTSKSDTQTSNYDSCESNSSEETLVSVPKLVVVEPKVVSFTFVNTVKHVKLLGKLLRTKHI